MKGGLSAGMQSTVTFSVEKGHAAAFEGRVIHNVLATVHLVYYAELAARNLIAPYLQEEEDAAGGGICLNHIAPTRIGDTVKVTAIFSGIDGKKLICRIEGSNSRGSVCNGTQAQIVVRKGSLG